MSKRTVTVHELATSPHWPYPAEGAELYLESLSHRGVIKALSRPGTYQFEVNERIDRYSSLGGLLNVLGISPWRGRRRRGAP